MSSVIYVGIGQCGNQILESFINHELSSNRPNYNYLLSNNEYLRCIFVDSEPKVLNKIKIQSNFRDRIREENMIAGLNGRGSNWCYGYNGCRSTPNITNQVLDGFRRELERCDNYMGTVLCHSLGGGTGAGFGSRLTQSMRDEFELHQIVNCSTAPSDIGGDSPLQYYNTLLTLATLNRLSDGVFLFHNDSLLNQLGLDLSCPIKYPYREIDHNRHLSPLPHKSVSVAQMNALIATQIGSLFAPCSSIYPWNSVLNIEINELLRSLCAFNDSKFVRCVSSSLINNDTSKDWNDLAKAINNQLKCGFGGVFDTISSVCCFRGAQKEKVDRFLPSISAIEKQLNIVNWNKSDALDIWIDKNRNDKRRISLAFNSACISNYLRFIIDRSKEKYNASAYLHSYYRFGGSKEIFLESFEELEKIISSYSTMK